MLADFEILADWHKDLGAHLRRLPMGFFAEGNIGRISPVLSTDMVFIEENLMTVLADLMSYLFAVVFFGVFMFVFDWRLGVLLVLVKTRLIRSCAGTSRSSTRIPITISASRTLNSRRAR